MVNQHAGILSAIKKPLMSSKSLEDRRGEHRRVQVQSSLKQRNDAPKVRG